MGGQATARHGRGTALSTRTDQPASPFVPPGPAGAAHEPGDGGGAAPEPDAAGSASATTAPLTRAPVTTAPVTTTLVTTAPVATGPAGAARRARVVRRANSGEPPHRTEELPGVGPAGAGGGTAGGSRHWPALDGLRAIAVLAVMLYHAGVTWLPGGLLGVDLFFVLSGFLITGLLLGEWDRSGRIDLARFWGRRARRLLPALVVALLAVCAYARFVASPTQAASLRSDALATLFYVGNWRFALSHQGYFDSTAPSPLRHTWSLAVEEQFYLIWPLIVIAVLGVAARRAPKKRRARRPAARLLRAVAVFGALASAGVAAVMSVTGVDDSRIYYGTDTRSQALFVGAALAGTLAMRGEPTGRARRVTLAGGGLVAMGAVLVVFATVDGQSTGLYRGGFLLLAIAVTVALASVVVLPASPLARVLSFEPLRYVGRISYGLYLYHWPLFLTMTAGRTHLTGGWLFVARFGATFAVAAASSRFVEQPIRSGTFRVPRPRLSVPATIAGVAVAVLGTTALIHAPAGAGGADAATLDRAAASTVQQPPPVVPKGNAVNRPTRVLLLGDSVAWTFGWNVGTEKINTEKYGVEFFNRAIIGCGIMGDIPQHVAGKMDYGNQVCPSWQRLWTNDVKATNPDVVAILIGRWETTDRLINGRWTNVGQPDFDAFLAGQLDSAIKDASSRGAKVALLTAPAYQLKEGPSGADYTETLADRVVAFNQQLQAAAARHPGLVSVIDFGHLLTPGGTYQSTIDGQVVRWSDGVHIAPAGTRLILPILMPELAKLRPVTGLVARGAPASATPAPPGRTSSAVPSAVPSAAPSQPPHATAGAG